MKGSTAERLIMDLHHEVIGQAVTINTLRAKVNAIEAANNEMVIAHAEAEPAILALGEIQEYLEEKVRLERAACGEPGMWARSPMGNSIALTLYGDLAKKLHQIRTGYGI